MRKNSISNLESEKRTIRHFFYFGTIPIIILLSVILFYVHSESDRIDRENKTQLLKSSLLQEKKSFLRNAVERTFLLIDHEREQTKIKYADKNLTEQQLEALAQKAVSHLIKKIRLIDNGYIWVNQIMNYDGGDKYAIRKIHPNLPQTEGQWLSTKTKDIKGNRPYEVELKGIKQDGEVFFEYYFKKMDSEKIAHKMSFAKLYKSYDWVIATGVYLDDINELVQDLRDGMQKTHVTQQLIILSISVTVVFASFLMVLFIERYVNRLVSNYEVKIDDYTTMLETLSTTDSLTGLLNRMRFDELLHDEIQRAQRYSKDFSMLFIDLDKFKNINDTYGHQTGDQVLVEFSKLIRNNTREIDIVSRLGGEEFIIILPDTTAEKAAFLAEKLRQLVSEHEFPAVTKLTCSIGISSYQKDDTMQSMIERADRAVYIAKNAGRNRVELEENS